MKKILVALSVMVFAGAAITACDAVSEQVANASAIIKKRLRSPASFTLVSGRTMWEGTDAEGNPAYIVRVEYDAQNGFGAMIRGCNLVAYTDLGDRISWNTALGVDGCGAPPLFTEEQVVEIMVSTNFQKKD